ncbi:hypothetical protein [uncultured Sphingomonas sp.]|uniref:hypothetical protein n=1 Tax=uncultured Sphingomonas sp. TaxID=158754 RepID=UPI0025848BAC|nr:hypothetical protein [uncultured Sphingomonas sp.]
MRQGLLLAVLAGLSACSAASGVTPAQREAAERWVIRDQMPAHATPIALWHANDNPASTLCGEIAAAGALRDRRTALRYIFDPNGRTPGGQVERHELWFATAAPTRQLLDTNRAIFDQLWSTHCAPFAPWRRKVAAWTGIDLDQLGWRGEAPRERSVAELREESREREARTRQIASELRTLP